MRLMRVCAAAFGQPRSDLFAVTRVALRAWPNDLDANLHVNNGRYLTLADLGRIDWFLRSQVLAHARRHGASPVVADALAKFRRELKVFEPCQLETQLLGWDPRSLYLETRFVCEGRARGVVAARIVFKGTQGTLAPEQFLRALHNDAAAPALPEWVTSWRDGSEALSLQLREREGALGG